MLVSSLDATADMWSALWRDRAAVVDPHYQLEQTMNSLDTAGTQDQLSRGFSQVIKKIDVTV